MDIETFLKDGVHVPYVSADLMVKMNIHIF